MVRAKTAAAREARNKEKESAAAHKAAALQSPFHFVIDCGLEGVMVRRARPLLRRLCTVC